MHNRTNKCTLALTDAMPAVQPKVRAVHCSEVGITDTQDCCRLFIQGDHLLDSKNYLTFPVTSSSYRCKQMAANIMLHFLKLHECHFLQYDSTLCCLKRKITATSHLIIECLP